MWWLSQGTKGRRQGPHRPHPDVRGLSAVVRCAQVAAISALCAGCFQPLYGSSSVTGGAGVREKLSRVTVQQIEAPRGSEEARLAVEIRNALLFDFTGTGGDSLTPPMHRLKVNISSTRVSIIVNTQTARPDIENYGINANFSLIEIATNKTVITGQTFSRVSYDIPGQEQRFARLRGLRDAETRAAKVISEQIRTRIASYFISGG